MKVDAYASAPQYWRHIAPIWEALPDDVRGTCYITRTAHKAMHGESMNRLPKDRGGPVIVASFADSQVVRPRPRILVEHGAGQTYPECPRVKNHGSYSGGAGHEGTVLFLCPNDGVASRWRSRYPQALSVTVGAPVLDIPLTRSTRGGTGAGVVAVCFHWDGTRWCPEIGWAFPEYQTALRALVQKYPVIGHGHPRVMSALKSFYRRYDIQPVTDINEVFDRADVLLADNSSIAMEFAATDRPIVWMNSSKYRKNVCHGGRFWEWTAAGIECNSPRELEESVELALLDPVMTKSERRRIVKQVYTYLDGSATQRAVDAILKVIGEDNAA